MADHLERTLESDAPLSAAVHQHDLAKEAAKAEDWRHAAVVGRTVTVNRPREEVYSLWRDLAGLPRFMEHVVRINDLGGGRSHWVVEAPMGRTVEWTSRITEDEPGEAIAWESEAGGDIRNAGRVEFRDAPPGRGCEVTATIIYDPPGGELGMLIAKLFQQEPKLQTRRDLRRFKQFAETGEVSVATAPDAAPRG
jgi:uncharacterized membrane protein